jgi:hypothetical protein
MNWGRGMLSYPPFSDKLFSTFYNFREIACHGDLV